MRKVKILSTNEVGYFHQFDMQNAAVIELENGTTKTIWAGDVQFIDSPEDRHIEDVAKAILQGLAQRNGWYWQGGGSRENLDGFLSSDFAKMYDEIISEFKKSKP